MNADAARKQLRTAEEVLANALLRVRSLAAVDEHTAWKDVYYGPSPKTIAKFRTQLPVAAQAVEAELEMYLSARAAKDEAVQQEKIERKARQEARAAAAIERAANPARPLARRNPVAAANYDTLSQVLAASRQEFIAKCVALKDDGDKKVAAAAAGAEFDGYVAKLARKITARITSGSLKGSLWSGSVLSVETEEGPQCWETSCIINRSVYNKLFNQWPTRQLC